MSEHVEWVPEVGRRVRSVEHRAHTRLRAGIALALCGLLALTGFLVLSPGSRHLAPERADFGKFASYVWFGPVSSVGASWTVPRILPGSPPGRAATWIGAQYPGFIQVGVIESRAAGVHGRLDRFAAFYSDTVLHFKPQALFPVAAGDAISARMTRAGGRWQLEIEDATSGARGEYATRSEADVPLRMAEWAQEDPTMRLDGTASPYPDLGPVDFRGLTVNSRPPSQLGLRSTWMSTGTRYVAPGPLVANSFSIGPRDLSSAGARYVRVIEPLNRSLGAFEAQIQQWRDGAAWSAVVGAGVQAAVAYAKATSELSRASWPPAAADLVRRLDERNLSIAARMRAAAAVPAEGRLVWIYSFAREQASGSTLGHLIRHELGLPDVSPPEEAHR